MEDASILKIVGNDIGEFCIESVLQIQSAFVVYNINY